MYDKNKFFSILENLKITNKDLSIAIGASSGNISDWKSGKSKPNIDAIVRTADYIDCSIDYLLGRETNPVPNDELGASFFYRLLISDHGILALKKELTTRMEAYGYDRLMDETGFTYRELREFSYPDVNIGYKCLINLDKILIALETNLFDVIKEIVLSEHTPKTISPSVPEYYETAAYGADETEGTVPPITEETT